MFLLLKHTAFVFVPSKGSGVLNQQPYLRDPLHEKLRRLSRHKLRLKHMRDQQGTKQSCSLSGGAQNHKQSWAVANCTDDGHPASDPQKGDPKPESQH